MDRKLAQEFRKTMKEAHAAFHYSLRNLVVYETSSSDTLFYVAPDIADQLTKDTAEIKKALAEWKSWLDEGRSGGMAKKFHDLAGTNVNVIILRGAFIGPKLAFSARRKNIMSALYTLDHEIGHQILRNGLYSADYNISFHKSESACDAFAMLCHIQRFGLDTPIIRDYPDECARHMLLWSKNHYASDTVDEVIRYARSMGDEFFNISLRDIAWLASDIADRCVLSDEKLDHVYNSFLPVKTMSDEQKNGQMICTKIFEIMRGDKGDTDILKMGRRLLCDKKFRIPANIVNPHWQKEFGFVKDKKKHVWSIQP